MRRTVRTFVAVELSPEVIARTPELIRRLALAEAPVKWVEPHNLHVTLKFLGEVETLEVAEVCNVVAEAVRGLPPFEFQALGAGAFPDAQRPRTVWLGMGQGSEEMITLHEAVERGLERLGFRREQRRFRPHLTLGRVRGSEDAEIAALGHLLAEHREYFGGVSDVTEVAIFSSELSRQGPTHEPLSHASLDGR